MRHDQNADFAPGELEQLQAEGEADITCGDLHDGDEVFRELDELIALRRKQATTRTRSSSDLP